MAALRRPAVVSHQSAAVLHGLPLRGVGLARVHVTRQPPASGELGRFLRCQVARLPDDDVMTVDGLAVTSPARTTVDLARVLPGEPAVVTLGAALRSEFVPPGLASLDAAAAGVVGGRRPARPCGLRLAGATRHR
ncbi:type IV toxin-antitoxin system AbiEi family antitoxin [Geodermatophilus sabuli]|uniref:type IV toxin-antitoxin system AbiEi family antitoxin n=1 Tax=Geodermatophilus sabuli TaxID=1564158 RepID=UPI003F7E4880